LRVAIPNKLDVGLSLSRKEHAVVQIQFFSLALYRHGIHKRSSRAEFDLKDIAIALPLGDGNSRRTLSSQLYRGRTVASDSSIPKLAPFPKHGDAGAIATGSIGAVDSLGNDAFCAKPASVREDDSAVLREGIH
jgi:hypothetical protein